MSTGSCRPSGTGEEAWQLLLRLGGEGAQALQQPLYGEEWEERRLRSQVHLTFGACLGACPVGNNALLWIMGCSFWLKDLNRPELIPLLFDYV